MTSIDPGGDPGGARTVDRLEIEELLTRYCYCCDINDAFGLAECFTVDCSTDYGPGSENRRGREARREDAARDLALFERTFHQLTNVVVQFADENYATSKSSVQAWHRTKVPGPPWVLRGQYHDELERTAEGWRISFRKLLVIDAENFPDDWDFHEPRRVS